MIVADPRSEMLAEMGQCAYRLGKVFGAEAERAETHAERLGYFQLFERCFFAARMSVALELRLRREARAAGGSWGRADAQGSQVDPAERDPVERDAPETESYTESETDRERERVSLPILLRTLDGVVAGALDLPGPPPAALPTLRELLARVKSTAAEPLASGRGSAARPREGGALKARLAGSAMAPARPPPSAPPLRPGLGPQIRRATGPPR